MDSFTQQSSIDIPSVLIYLTVFSLSIFFAFLGQRTFRSSPLSSVPSDIFPGKIMGRYKKRLTAPRLSPVGIVFMGVSLLLPCILAALRDASVGIDLKVYVTDNFLAAENSASFSDFYTGGTADQLEPLFALLMYFCAEYFNSAFFLFAVQLLISLPVYLILIKYSDKISVPFALAIYYLVFFNFFLSCQRQGIAMGLVLFVWHYLRERRYVKGTLAAVLAAGFHTSAVLIVMALIAVEFIVRRRRMKGIIITGCIFLVLLFVFYKSAAMGIAELVSLVKPRYAFYIKKYINTVYGLLDVPMSDLMSMVILTVPTFLTAWKTGIKDRSEISLTILCFLSIYFTLFYVNFYESTRIAYYFRYFQLLYIPVTVSRIFRSDWQSRTLYKAGMVSVLLFYWLYYIMYIGAYYTNYYVFA